MPELLFNKHVTEPFEQDEWLEDVLLYEAANGNAEQYFYLLENRTIVDVWRMLTIKRAMNYFH